MSKFVNNCLSATLLAAGALGCKDGNAEGRRTTPSNSRGWAMVG